MNPNRWTALAVAAGLAIGVGFVATRSSAEGPRAVPAAAVDESLAAKPAKETAVLAGGCFWGVQGVFQHVKGVANAVSGYAGGDKGTAQYYTVGSGTTGHAESVRVSYDPSQITYGQILRIYFSVAHDPTELNHQGADEGTQYRSAIFAQNDDQARIAKAYIAELDAAKVYKAPVVTVIETGRQFFPAEDYHQDYLTLNPTQPYIAYNDIPKVEALKAIFPDLYRDKPVLVSSVGLTE
jgi:peptide-methionine (S)-S-oxide reductase